MKADELRKMEGLDKAIAILTRKGIAETCGVTTAAITNWRTRGVPAECCLPIMRATKGFVTVFELRPDVFSTPEEICKKCV